MSLEAMIWVLSGDAPVADVNEFAVLGAMADQADSDGCATWLAKETIAERVHVSEETVKRCWRNLLKRRLIGKGDQSLVRHYRADRRPVVYDLLIPHDWFPNLERVNRERDRKGREPLTAESRPPIAAPPVKRGRVDKGKPRPLKPTSERGNSETPRPEAPKTPHGGTTSRPRGNYKSSTGELEDPQPSKSTPSIPTEETASRPSVREPEVGAREADSTDGRTDGGGGSVDQEDGPGPAGGQDQAAADAAPDNSKSAATGTGATAAGGPVPVPGPRAREMSEGTDLLVTVGKINDVLKLAGKPLSDQGARVDGLLAGGWPRHALISILSAPIGEIRTSAGAVVSARISALPHRPPASHGGAGADSGAGARPERTGSGDTSHSATAAADRSVGEALTRRVIPECACGDPLAAGFDACPACLGWPVCSGGCGRRSADGTCAGCRTEADHAALAAGPTEDGTCPGHSGPCGREVVSLGWCGACRIAAQRAADARQDDPAVEPVSDAELAAMIADATRAVECAADTQPHNAPF